MFDWIASLLVIFLHGNTARAVASQPSTPTGSRTVHTMDSGSPTNPSGPSPIVDGSNQL
jgi:hypothetical protein